MNDRYIVTRSGGKFWYDNPMYSQYTIEDIAYSLAHLCRFVGHCRIPYSVAQHSLMVSRIVPEEYALSGLLHDAAEAFCGDIASPLKSLLPGYKEIEDKVQEAIMARFGAPWNPIVQREIKRADLIALATEKRDLLPICEDWEVLRGVQPSVVRVDIPEHPELVAQEFVQRFNGLTGRAQ